MAPPPNLTAHTESRPDVADPAVAEPQDLGGHADSRADVAEAVAVEFHADVVGPEMAAPRDIGESPSMPTGATSAMAGSEVFVGALCMAL